jgi:hypothetical protein
MCNMLSGLFTCSRCSHVCIICKSINHVQAFEALLSSVHLSDVLLAQPYLQGCEDTPLEWRLQQLQHCYCPSISCRVNPSSTCWHL